MTANETFYRSIGNMISENLDGCSVGPHSKSNSSGFEAMKSVQYFLSNVFIEESKKKIDKIDGKAKINLLNDLNKYDLFNKNLGMVIKAIEAINKCIQTEEDNKKPKKLIHFLKNNDGLISRIFEHLINVIDDPFKEKDLYNISLVKEQNILFKKYRVKVHEKNIMSKLMDMDCEDNTDLKLKATHIINTSCNFLTEETVDLLLG